MDPFVSFSVALVLVCGEVYQLSGFLEMLVGLQLDTSSFASGTQSVPGIP